jgi:hypothetical protein
MHLRPVTLHDETFISAKTLEPVPHAGGIVTDALVQQSLDPQVLRLSFLSKAGPPAAEIELGVVTVLRSDGRFHLDIVPARPLLSSARYDRVQVVLDALGLKPLTLTAAEIMKEPRFSSARTVWRHRRFRSSVGMRLRLLAALFEEGPISIDLLCRMVPGPEDPFASILAMACSDEVELDLVSGPLGPATMVRHRA